VVFYELIVKYSPDSFQGHNNLGLQYEYLGRFDEARLEYKRALEIKPDLVEARSNLANLYFKLKLYSQAKVEYALLENSPLGSKAGEVANNFGNLYEAMGDFDAAIKKYTLALKFDPSLKFTYFNLARIYYAKKEINLAIKQIAQSLGKISSNNADKDIDKIIGDFFKNTGGVNNAAEFYNNLGIYFAQNKFLTESVSAFNCALELSPKSDDYYYNLALAYLNMGLKIKAKNALKQALKINPNHIRAKRLIAIN
jgi:tetratricopeptide (TPR) repeat protein